ncbi:hypothetical protein BROUX41_003727 [Berkeleyomyces rouxiae]|uniref:uncharacterized protein n=1 Tax=Berkeleyomyces rouxiae TaxID=2035830 RepID=UPI003B7A5E2A
MDLDELPSAGLTDAHYEHLELFPEVTRAESATLESQSLNADLASSITAASPVMFSATISTLGDELLSVAAESKPTASKKLPVKKKGMAAKRVPNATSVAAKGPKATSGAKTSTTRRPKAKSSALASTATNGASSVLNHHSRENGGSTTRDSPAVADSDDPGTYCLCQGRDDHRWMICCEKCEDWFHGECIDLDTEMGESLIEMFVCPRCTDGDMLVTRYKKTCSLDGCRKPARSYAPAVKANDEDDTATGAAETEDVFNNSVFCSDEHCHQWWEHIVSCLPPASTIPPTIIGKLTREDLLGVIASGLGYVDEATGTYKLVRQPFLTPDSNNDESEDEYLSSEEQSLLAQSSADRAALATEVELCRKMLTLVDRVTERHRAAVTSGFITNDICGYDSRLDCVCVQAAFAVFLSTQEGEASFAQDELQPPLGELAAVAAIEEENDPDHRHATAGMCDKKRCKAHQGWAAMFHKAVKNQIRQLTNQIADLLSDEEVIRSAALERYGRKKVEKNWVEVVGTGAHIKQENVLDIKMGDAMDLD